MAKAKETLEHMGHAAHAGSHGHGHHQEQSGQQFSTYVGVTMAVLGVVLAFASAKVGGERTLLVKALVEQQNAHAKYQAQDIKHRQAVLSLRQVHAAVPLGIKLDESKRNDIVVMARTVDRYFQEATAARVWVEAFDPKVEAHVEGQEHYEWAMLAAEIGIVIASVALLLKLRFVWFLAVGLGLLSVTIIGATFAHTASIVGASEYRIEHADKTYRDLRTANKQTAVDQALVDEIYTAYGGKPAAAAPATAGHGQHK